MESIHGRIMDQTREVDTGKGGEGGTYVVSFPHGMSSVDYTMEGWPEGPNTPVRLHEIFGTGIGSPKWKSFMRGRPLFYGAQTAA